MLPHLVILVIVDVVAAVRLGVDDLVQARLQLDGHAVHNVCRHNGPGNNNAYLHYQTS